MIGISCSDGLGPVAGISGNVSFSGEWPDSLSAAVVAVFLNIPSSLDEEPDGISDLIPSGVSESSYFIQVNPANYAIMLVAGVKPDSSVILLKVLGSVGVETGTETPNIDVEIQF